MNNHNDNDNHITSHQHHAPSHIATADPHTKYVWRIHHPYKNLKETVAIEVAPKKGLIPRWRFVVPQDFDGILKWGSGPSDGGEVDINVKNPSHGGPVQLINGPEVIWFGGIIPLSSKISAYLVFEGSPPHYVAFGQADDVDGPPKTMEGISFGEHADHPH